MITSYSVLMRSRAARLTIGFLAVIAIGAAGEFLFSVEKHIAERMTSLRAFDLHAREAADALADVRAAQQAYVALGQGVTFWMPKVATTTDALTSALASLRRSAESADARAELDQASASVDDFAEVDKRARDYVKAGQQLMAADVIFTEGTQAAATATQHVERARLAEQQGFDATEAQMRKQQALAIAAAAGVALLVLLILALAAPRAASSDATAATESVEPVEAPVIRTEREPTMMKAAADLATEVGRARDFDDLTRLLGSLAELMDASGVVVWVGNLMGGELKPVLAHGYPPQTLARMAAVPKSADNAAAKAYRTGALQIVLSRPGVSTGAIVAPILTADGCIGAVSAEIRSGGETAQTVQAVAAIFAAQLANVIAPAPAVDAASDPKTASA